MASLPQNVGPHFAHSVFVKEKRNYLLTYSYGQIIAPQGWTTGPDELDIGYVWGSRNSPGQVMARECGLNAPWPIMCSATDTGEGCVMFQSGSAFYIWNQMDDGVWEITVSQDLNVILQKMYKTDTEGLKLKECPGATGYTTDGKNAGGNNAGGNNAGGNSAGGNGESTLDSDEFR
jgi:hypothetical protein